ncbi:MAG TPA: DUF3467 domain-containing protein [Phycisphaerae bacterium]|nr:DUF3467 domain-containing protein [Phycisphaerae bacterium]
MSDANTPGSGGSGKQENPGEMQRIAHSPMSARVPEKVARGVLATAFLSYFGPQEFVIDFLQLIGRPPQLAARIVMTPAVAEQFIHVLKENLTRYTANYGPPPTIPKNPNDKPRTAQEIYDDLKLPDDQLSGVYANAVLVGHTPAEFGMDFITSFFPTAAVCARVYLSAPRIPQLIETLSGLVAQYHKQRSPGPNVNPGGGGGGGGQGGTGYGTAPGIPGFPTPPSN